MGEEKKAGLTDFIGVGHAGRLEARWHENLEDRDRGLWPVGITTARGNPEGIVFSGCTTGERRGGTSSPSWFTGLLKWVLLLSLVSTPLYCFCLRSVPPHLVYFHCLFLPCPLGWCRDKVVKTG